MNYEIAFIKALSFTIALEMLSAGGLKYFLAHRFSLSYKKLFLIVACASFLTLPYLWFVFPAFLKGTTYIIFSEIFAVIVEALFYRLVLTKDFSTAILLSFTANALSFLIGNVIL